MIGIDHIEARRERDRPDGLSGGDILATVEIEGAAAQRNAGGIVEAIRQGLRGLVAGVGAVIELQRRVTDLERAHARESRLGHQVRRAAVEHGITRERLEAVQRESILTRAHEIREALDLPRPGAPAIILVQNESGRRAGAIGDDAVDVGHDAVTEERIDLLHLAVEVEGAAHHGQVIVRLDRVVRVKFDGAVIDHHLAAIRVRALRGEAIDIRQRGLQGEDTRPSLHEPDVAVREAVTAIQRGDQIQVAQCPEVERQEIAGLINDATGEGRGGRPGANQDTTALQRKLGSRGDLQRATGLNRERVRGDRGWHVHRRECGGEVGVKVLGDEIIVVVLVQIRLARRDTGRTINLLIERPEIGVTAIRRGERSPHARLGAIDQHPGHQALIALVTAAALPGPPEAVPPQHRGTEAGAEVGAADEEAHAGRCTLLRRETGAHPPDLQHGIIQVIRDDRDGGGTAPEISRTEPLAGEALIRGPDQLEVTAAEREGVTRPPDEVTVNIERCRSQATEGGVEPGRKIIGERGPLVDGETGAPTARVGEIHRTLADDEGPTVHPAVQGDVLRIRNRQRARTILLNGVEIPADSPRGDLRATQDDITRAREI